MAIIYILIGISMLLALIFLGAFFWASKSGQFEDDHTPSIRMLFENRNSSEQDGNSEV
jgi:cbb3-type cytochrome oxidase maturation protein